LKLDRFGLNLVPNGWQLDPGKPVTGTICDEPRTLSRVFPSVLDTTIPTEMCFQTGLFVLRDVSEEPEDIRIDLCAVHQGLTFQVEDILRKDCLYRRSNHEQRFLAHLERRQQRLNLT
jgi:hypothetical protein